DSAAKPVIHPRLPRSIASERRGLRTESGGSPEAASCSRIHAQLIARAETNVSRIANPIECTASLRAHRYTWRGGPDRVSADGPDRHDDRVRKAGRPAIARGEARLADHGGLGRDPAADPG